MPLTVYGQEYTAGLLGWNDELSPIELQVRNLKTTWENLAKVWELQKIQVHQQKPEYYIQ